MQLLILVLLIANLALTAFLISRSKDIGNDRASKQASVSDHNQLSQHRRAEALVQAVESLPANQTRLTVEQLLGLPSNPHDNEWIYHLDRHSGYEVIFDDDDNVVSVTSWKS